MLQYICNVRSKPVEGWSLPQGMRFFDGAEWTALLAPSTVMQTFYPPGGDRLPSLNERWWSTLATSVKQRAAGTTGGAEDMPAARPTIDHICAAVGQTTAPSVQSLREELRKAEVPSAMRYTLAWPNHPPTSATQRLRSASHSILESLGLA